MRPVIRPEYIDAAIEKTDDAAEIVELNELKSFIAELEQLEDDCYRQCIANRIKAGENPKRIGAPKSIAAASEKAAEDAHQFELRKCRRAETPADIVHSLLALSRSDCHFNRPLLKHIDLPANRTLNEDLLAKKDELQSRFVKFLAKWPGDRS